MKNALVVGFGLSGKAACCYLRRRGWEVTAVDRKPEGNVLSDQTDFPLDFFDLGVFSPGVRLNHPLGLCCKKVIGEAELALRDFKGRAIGITGTNGKSTVTAMVTHILNSAGVEARAVGNIGSPLSQAVDEVSSEVLVVELSSYQLETLNVPVFDVATILNITADHLDRYENMNGYAAAKWRIASCMKRGAFLYVPKGLSRLGTKSYGFDPTCDLYVKANEVFLEESIETILPVEYRGTCDHHVQNWLIAYGLCRAFEVEPDEFHKGFSSFHGLPHRMEWVRELRGVTWINDSKGTNIDAVRVAVESISAPIRLIAGGQDKKGSFSKWLDSFAGKVKEIYAIGEVASILEATLGKEIPVFVMGCLKEAVDRASRVAEPGDWVLLSPGCASFDQFPNFEERGNCYKELVGAIE